ncbi:copper chaperone PCu(A)C [Pokkaliibacter sp. CJK22405]|uniref:copper chaperone PCu(A)C n=1 Tax=Pokkaliibacter sp. CJK22405 TaxID=3384615 RepID=UPI003984F026
MTLKTLIASSVLFSSTLLAATQAMAEVSIDNAYVRATPPGVTSTAGFMTLTNNGDQAVTLTGVDSTISMMNEVHNHEMKDGMMAMRKVENFILEAHQSITLKPGGYHLMMMGLEAPVKAGEKVGLTLHFSDNSEAKTEAEAKSIMAN